MADTVEIAKTLAYKEDLDKTGCELGTPNPVQIYLVCVKCGTEHFHVFYDKPSGSVNARCCNCKRTIIGYVVASQFQLPSVVTQ